MKESPIIFNTEMVQAILSGRKSQTRRILKKIPRLSDNINQTAKYLIADKELREIKSPFGKPGDLIWVRETFMKSPNADLGSNQFRFKATVSNQYFKPWAKSWKPSIHMPKIAARIWLKVKDVKVERLNEIKKEDAINEGIQMASDFEANQKHPYYYFYPCNDLRDDTYIDDPRTSFYSLWRTIHGEDSWQENPWVWVVEFEVISIDGKPE